jgi:hypothetical protein
MKLEKIPWKEFLRKAPELFTIVLIVFLYLLLLPELIRALAIVPEYILLTVIALTSGLIFLVCLYLILLASGRPHKPAEEMSNKNRRGGNE